MIVARSKALKETKEEFTKEVVDDRTIRDFIEVSTIYKCFWMAMVWQSSIASSIFTSPGGWPGGQPQHSSFRVQATSTSQWLSRQVTLSPTSTLRGLNCWSCPFTAPATGCSSCRNINTATPEEAEAASTFCRLEWFLCYCFQSLLCILLSILLVFRHESCW